MFKKKNWYTTKEIQTIFDTQCLSGTLCDKELYGEDNPDYETIQVSDDASEGDYFGEFVRKYGTDKYYWRFYL